MLHLKNLNFVPEIAVIGSGPAGLMAAHTLLSQTATPVKVTLIEKRKSPGRKLLIAGSSGLNIAPHCDPKELPDFYQGDESLFFRVFHEFSAEDWLKFVNDLGLETFLGTSPRYFVKEMKASGLLKAWTEKLKELGCEFQYDAEVTDFETKESGKVAVSFTPGETKEFDAVCFCLGGGSWEPTETPLRWPALFQKKGIKFEEFQPSNAGYEINWKPEFIKEAEGLPLKRISLETQLGLRKGELMVTSYGLEGTPIYTLGTIGQAYLDLRPEQSPDKILKKLIRPGKENLSPIRKMKKELNLCDATHALLFHYATEEEKKDLKSLVTLLKNFPLTLKGPRPLQEAISSSGGVSLEELDENLMLKNHPGVFLAGEMLAWDAPTGGFLIQASVSQGYFAARSIAERFNSEKKSDD